MRMMANLMASIVIFIGHPNSAQSSYLLHDAVTNDIKKMKTHGKWITTSDTDIINNIHKNEIVKKRKQKKRYCAGIPSSNSPMYLNSCDIIGKSKGDQAESSGFYESMLSN